MSFLLAKILFLLVLAAACGAAFTYWWFRRRYEDITLEYTRWRDEVAEWRRSFEERLAERPPVDLHPLSQQLTAVDAAVRGIHIPQPEPTDLRPVLDAVAGIRIPKQERVDLEPVQLRLDALESRVADIRVPEIPRTLDLTPIEQRLAALEDAVRSIHPKAEMPGGARNLLSQAVHGKPDDLKQIKGIERSLERKLHKVGVFYFWQIADWQPEDVAYVDSKLSEFRGHIERDDWVTQAGELASLPSAAPRPAQH